MKKGLLWMMLVALAAFMVACSTESPVDEGNAEGGTSEGGDGDFTVGLSISTLNNPFFVTLQEGAEAKAEELGVDLITVDAQDDDAKQISDVEDLIQRGVDLILINPTDSTSVTSAIAAANAAGIPVITVDRGAEGGEVVSHIASDNVAGGEMAGELLKELVGEGAEVAELEGIPGSSAARERGEGFHNVAEGSLEVAAKQTANFNRAEGLTVMENILQSNPEITGVFAHNDEMALGALEAIDAAGRDDIVIVGFDATDDAVAAVEAGRLAGTVAQQPTLIGETAVATAFSVLSGDDVEEFIPVDLELVTNE
ncbi:ribose ABC transporter substrate-binding protein RbsB [Halalkalibacterium halodurans]|jgi:ribose transport system substrate-binding protein|uniref:Ribose ABC transporter (Ribose-binding protein) n=2 Tax=Halalkalibacterium halodurans TaxID=86665 RepID=Q9K6J7_HALH5|nr:ribose ABC transporter substrate-binding protein RbsB [Halalkalibacterium halodurans]MED3647244.1 ribose ABC transporter substrate-binding protein RbsB [Halalkalibacterium halodurans]MED4079826.1 ribose ABC transporter substrate-binding protein RbsB [Halalkalibacterium halodurans]MED4083748.1 ribose ABC transporter substrate-binding protein RbsB [Halalkalibacterium halodurans]MED4106563.1 ribose ABC transporter substrate-binding protein RbsB [Halalkalibacterium halodurans]MED4109589.1 ribos